MPGGGGKRHVSAFSSRHSSKVGEFGVGRSARTTREVVVPIEGTRAGPCVGATRRYGVALLGVDKNQQQTCWSGATRGPLRVFGSWCWRPAPK